MRLDQIRPGHVFLLVLILGATLWYLLDTLDTSRRLTNTILVVPLAILVFAAGAFELIREILRARADPTTLEQRDVDEDQDSDQTPVDMLRGVVLLGFTGLLVFFYPRLGFDLAVFLFIFASLVMLEPRGYLAKAAFAAIFTLIVLGGARIILPYPMPTLIL